MAKIIQFSANATPEKFGLQKARKKKDPDSRPGQLPLFTGAKIIKLNQLSLFEEALLADEQGDNKAAREHYQRAIAQGDCIADSYCNLGILESLDGNYSKGIDYFTLCLKFEPRHYEAHYNLANVYAEMGNYPLAKIHYQISLEIEPAFSNCYFNLGLALAMNKEYREAIAVLAQHKNLTPAEDHRQTDDLIFKLSGMV